MSSRRTSETWRTKLSASTRRGRKGDRRERPLRAERRSIVNPHRAAGRGATGDERGRAGVVSVHPTECVSPVLIGRVVIRNLGGGRRPQDEAPGACRPAGGSRCPIQRRVKGRRQTRQLVRERPREPTISPRTDRRERAIRVEPTATREMDARPGGPTRPLILD